MFFSHRRTTRQACSFTAALLIPCAVLAEPLQALPSALSTGTPHIDVRLRYESVEQSRPASIRHRAEAATLRSRLGYTTARWSGLDAQLEFEHLGIVGLSNYNSTENVHKRDVGTYPVIADPEGSELNQAWLRYSGPAKTTMKLGRQRLIFDNARFIGNVGWRQREQTFDAALLSTALLPKTTAQYAYLDKVHAPRSFNYGTLNTPRLSNKRPLEGHVIHVALTPMPALKLSAYGYWLDFNAETLRTIPAPPAPLDSRTLGLRASGSSNIKHVPLTYALEYAHQDEHGDADARVNAHYGLVELGTTLGPAQLKLGHEVLGSQDGRYGFQTPLATSHAFQGWADVFLVTPPNGIEETYLSAATEILKLSLFARYSRFHAAEGSGRYGDEINLQVTHNLTPQLGLGVKYAAYFGASDAPVPPTGAFAALRGDVDKAWAWVEYKW